MCLHNRIPDLPKVFRLRQLDQSRPRLDQIVNSVERKWKCVLWLILVFSLHNYAITYSPFYVTIILYFSNHDLL